MSQKLPTFEGKFGARLCRGTTFEQFSKRHIDSIDLFGVSEPLNGINTSMPARTTNRRFSQ
jgi:hypothetical protein